ncbi:9265_t:CDS:1, partial [Cetraspora pellucida]
ISLKVLDIISSESSNNPLVNYKNANNRSIKLVTIELDQTTELHVETKPDNIQNL